jgi:hypothetical protein
LKDISGKKIWFQIVVGETYFRASLDVTGTANLTLNIDAVIKATAALEANFHDGVVLMINPSTNTYTMYANGYLHFSDWLGNIGSILTYNQQEAFLEVGASFGEDIKGVATAEAPFNILPEATFIGIKNTNEIDFLKLGYDMDGISIPNVNLTVQIEGTGNVKDLTFCRCCEEIMHLISWLEWREVISKNGKGLVSFC